MNRFRTKKRAKDTSDIVGTEANRSDSPSVPALKSSKTFRLGRKNTQEPESKPQLDLANALPSSDDFRTSLLMSGLSARFSMLREQDDPKSKIGKAADDSVLFPKRQSRLNDFGFHSTGLDDIAEVSSIKASIRPPFASNRVDSFHSVESSGDDVGSIMSRAKPGEGNNLFGGRQKIYKIPVGSTNSNSGKMGGRALYEDDVSQSAFQKLRDREKEEREREREEQRKREDEAHSFFPLRSNSPPLLGYNRNRETSSTTSSGPSLTRSSTAATSVYSQGTPSINSHSSPSTPAVPTQSNGIDRSMTKGKRLYETGLDQHLHSQQHLAMNRLESLSRQQTFGARTPSPSPFPNGNIYEHPNAPGPTSHHIAARSASPPPTESTSGAFDFGVKATALLDTSKSLFTAPPLSPPMSDGDDQPSLPIQPNDRGKATALGAFSKPVQPYDEMKYSQRQLQMQQGREISPLRRHSPPRPFNSRQANSGRTRTESNATYTSERSASSSSGQREFIPRNQNMTSPIARAEPPVKENLEKSPGTFFDSRTEESSTLPSEGMLKSGNSWGHPATRKIRSGRVPNALIPLQRPPESQHPAHRASNQHVWENYNEIKVRDEPPTSNPLSNVQESQSIQKSSSSDSPTLGPVEDLSGLVRQHLRNDSGASSMYGTPSPGLEYLTNPTPPPNSNPYTTKGNPWEINDWDEDNHGQLNGINHASSDPTMSSRSYGVSTHSTPPKANGTPEKNSNGHSSSWEDEIAQRHKRNDSTETQKEQVDFTNKLASARKRVQDNLKSFAESDSRSASPKPSIEWEKDSASSRNNPIAMVKAKSSRESILAKSRNTQSKAMKMLGIGNSEPNTSSSSPGKQKYEESPWKQEEEEMLRGVKPPRNPPPTKAYRQARRDAQRDRERQVLMRHRNGGARSSGEDEEAAPESTSSAASMLAKAQAQLRQHTREGEVEPERKPAPRDPSQESGSSARTTRSGSRPPSGSARDRSGSDTSGGSKSRNGRYRDDLARAMAEGHSSSGQGFFEDTVSTRATAKSPALAYSPATAPPAQSRAARSGSESNPTYMGYFDNQQLQSAQNSPQIDNGAFPRPSPIAPYAENRTPALSHPSPFQSGNNTPTSQGFQSQGRIPAHLKRVVNKSQISEPSLVSRTSHMITVDLPVGASLQNGMHSAPPLPPMDSRRRTVRTQGMVNGLMSKSNETMSTPSLPAAAYYEESNMFSADEAEQKPKARQKIRKISSEGGNLNGRVRQVYGAPSPAIPAFPAANTHEINMF